MADTVEKDFRIGDVLRFGWQVMVSNFWFFVGVFVVVGVLPRLLSMIPLLGWIASSVLCVILGIGLIRIALSFCDQTRPPFEMLFQAKGYFWPYLTVSALYSLIVIFPPVILFASAAAAGAKSSAGGTIFSLLGMVAMVLGVYLAIKYQYGTYLVIDQKLGAVDALRASALMTQGIRLKLLGFGVLCTLIMGAGILCLGVGVFVTGPTALIAWALTYRHLLAQTPELRRFGIEPVYTRPPSPVVTDAEAPPAAESAPSTPPEPAAQPSPADPAVEKPASGWFPPDFTPEPPDHRDTPPPSA